MALIKCPDCGKQVSDQAPSCPNCGRVLKKKTGCLSYFIFGFSILIIVGVIGSLMNGASNKSTTPTGSNKMQKGQYDLGFKKSTNQYGVTFYRFKRLKGPRVELISSNNGIKDITQLNEILTTIGEPRLNSGEQYRVTGGKSIFVWDNYEKGKLVVNLGECKYYDDDKKTYTCIDRLYIEPSNKDKMMNQAINSKTRIFVSRDTYGDEWPFTIDFGIIECRRYHAVVFRTEDHQVYALNGKAIAMKEFKDVREIWKHDPNIPGSRASLSKLIQEGLNLCE